MKQDVTILYQGGSGGFALFYYLLLSGQYSTGLEYNSVQDLIDQQFSLSLITSPGTWKHQEFWPDNQKCKRTDTTPRLFLICNPMWTPAIMQQNLDIGVDTHRVLLYTDFKLQLRMCWEKKAYWFTNVSRQAFNAPETTKQYLRQIIHTQVDDLDPQVTVIKKIFKPAQTIELTQFIKSKILNGFDMPNQAQLDFLDRWISLQPKKVQRLL